MKPKTKTSVFTTQIKYTFILIKTTEVIQSRAVEFFFAVYCA